jgi:hypothetical protein
VTPSLVEYSVDTADGVLWALNLDLVDGLLESWLSGELARVDDSPGGGDDLSASSMDGVGVKGDIVDIVSAASHVLIAEYTLFTGPLESRSPSTRSRSSAQRTPSAVSTEYSTSEGVTYSKKPRRPVRPCSS